MSDLTQLLSDASKNFEKKTGKRLLNPVEMHEHYGVKFMLSTGMPHVDLYCANNNVNIQSDHCFGIPCGRVTEFHGETQSYKSFMIHTLAADAVAKGGFAIILSSEHEHDLAHFKRFYKRRGIDEETMNEKVKLTAVHTVGEVTQFALSFFEPIRKYYEDGGKPVPCFIGLDSLAGLTGEENWERLYEENKDERTGSGAAEIHRLFKLILEDCARYNVAFVFANHCRQNIGGYGGLPLPAHDAAVKYWCTLRIRLQKSNSGANKTVVKTDYGSMLTNEVVLGRIWKKRGLTVGEDSFEIHVNINDNFDFLHSVNEALRMTGIVRRVTNQSIGIFLNTEDEFEREIYDMLIEKGCSPDNDFKMKNRQFADLIKDNLLDLVPRLTKLVYLRGPIYYNIHEMTGEE